MAFTDDVSAVAEQMMKNFVRIAPMAQRGKKRNTDAVPEATSVPDLSEIDVTVPEALLQPPGEEDIWRRLAEVLERHAEITLRDQGAVVMDGDELLVDMHERHKGEFVPGTARVDAVLPLTDAIFLPALKERLVGRRVGERLRLSVDLADGPGTVELAIFIKSARRVEVPSLTDPRIFEILGRGDTVKAVVDSITHELHLERAQLQRTAVQNLVLEEIADRTEVDVPTSLLEDELRSQWMKIEGASMATAGYSTREQRESQAAFLQNPEIRFEAEQRLRTTLALGAIAKRDGITVTREDMQAWLAALAEEGADVDAVKAELKNEKNALFTLFDKLLYLKTVAHCVSQVKINLPESDALQPC